MNPLQRTSSQVSVIDAPPPYKVNEAADERPAACSSTQTRSTAQLPIPIAWPQPVHIVPERSAMAPTMPDQYPPSVSVEPDHRAHDQSSSPNQTPRWSPVLSRSARSMLSLTARGLLTLAAGGGAAYGANKKLLHAGDGNARRIVVDICVGSLGLLGGAALAHSLGRYCFDGRTAIEDHEAQTTGLGLVFCNCDSNNGGYDDVGDSYWGNSYWGNGGSEGG